MRPGRHQHLAPGQTGAGGTGNGALSRHGSSLACAILSFIHGQIPAGSVETLPTSLWWLWPFHVPPLRSRMGMNPFSHSPKIPAHHPPPLPSHFQLLVLLQPQGYPGSLASGFMDAFLPFPPPSAPGSSFSHTSERRKQQVFPKSIPTVPGY